MPPLTDEADVTLAKRQRLLCGTFLPFTSNSPRSADDYSAAVSTLFQVAKAEQSENLFVHFSLAVAGAFGRVL